MNPLCVSAQGFASLHVFKLYHYRYSRGSPLITRREDLFRGRNTLPHRRAHPVMLLSVDNEAVFQPLLQLGRPLHVARFPRLEFPGQILVASFAQLSNDLRILCRQLVLQFIQSFDRRKDGHRNFDSVLRHTTSILICARKANSVDVSLRNSVHFRGTVVLLVRRRQIGGRSASQLSTINSHLLSHCLELRAEHVHARVGVKVVTEQ
jgi:hypothetical protein